MISMNKNKMTTRASSWYVNERPFASCLVEKRSDIVLVAFADTIAAAVCAAAAADLIAREYVVDTVVVAGGLAKAAADTVMAVVVACSADRSDH